MEKLISWRTKYDPDTKTWTGPDAFVDRKLKMESVGRRILNGLSKSPESIIQISHETKEKVTRNEMKLMSIRIAQHLQNLGCKQGDHIMIIARNNPRVGPVFYGSLLMGGVVNSLDVTFEERDFRNMISNVQPCIIFVEQDLLQSIVNLLSDMTSNAAIIVFGSSSSGYQSVNDLLIPTGKEDQFKTPEIDDLLHTTAIIVCSSGTTGLNKGIRLSHDNISGLNFPHLENTIYYAASSLFWLSGFQKYLVSAYFPMTYCNSEEPFSPESFVEIIEQNKIEMTLQRPAQIVAIVEYLEQSKNRADLSSIKVLISGGANLSQEYKLRMESFLNPNVKIVETYAISEIGSIVLAHTAFASKPDSTGCLTAPIGCRIYKENGEQCGPNEPGNIHFSNLFPFLGYINDEKATKEALDENGCFITGDLGYFDEDGFLFIIGRLKDMFTYKGNRVYPLDIENILLKHENIIAAAAIGIPHEKDDYHLAACVIPTKNSNLTEADVLKYVNDQVPDYKKIRAGVHFYKVFQETASSKIKKRILVEEITKLLKSK